jgi:predicted nuclease of predicted toxin-antitoxin system
LKILLDEGVPKIIQKRLSNLSISNVEEMGWRGIKNGELLDLMSGQFQILVTTDKNLPSQQNLKKRQISALILPTNDIPSVIELLPQIEQALATIDAGEFQELKMPPQ